MLDFDTINFIDDENVFRLSSSSRDESISIAYPFDAVDKSFENKDMMIFFFHNTYLQSENDVFQVYINNNRIGWIFPLQSIITEENDFSQNSYFNKYKYVTYKEILKNNSSYKNFTPVSDNLYKLDDFFPDDIIILCVSVEKLSDDFSIENYLPSLCNFGYYIQNDNPYINSINNNKLPLFAEYKGKSKLKIEPSKVNIEEHFFIKNLYINHLKRIDDTTLKFFLLYQVVEYLIEKEFNIKFDKALEDYNNSRIDKNNFREKLNSYSKERNLIKSFTTDFSLPEKLSIDLSRDLRLMLDELLPDYDKSDIGDLIYDLRNILIHRYRDIDILDKEKLNLFDLITNQIELAINHYLINYSRNTDYLQNIDEFKDQYKIAFP